MIFIYLPTLLYTIEHVVIIVSLQWTIVGLANFETFNSIVYIVYSIYIYSIYFWQRTTSFSLHVPCLKKHISQPLLLYIIIINVNDNVSWSYILHNLQKSILLKGQCKEIFDH